MPLYLAKEGDVVHIVRITGNVVVKKHLNNMGFVVGCELTIVSALNGNLIVKLKDSRIAVTKDMAKRIFIQP